MCRYEERKQLQNNVNRFDVRCNCFTTCNLIIKSHKATIPIKINLAIFKTFSLSHMHNIKMIQARFHQCESRGQCIVDLTAVNTQTILNQNHHVITQMLR